MSHPERDTARPLNPYVAPGRNKPGDRDFRPKPVGVQPDSLIEHTFSAPEQPVQPPVDDDAESTDNASEAEAPKQPAVPPKTSKGSDAPKGSTSES